MANTKSAEKNARKNSSRYERNRAVKTKLKTLEKKFQSSLESKDGEETRESARIFISALDKAAKSALVHRNKVARKKASSAKAIVDMPSGENSQKPAAKKESSEESE
jgi:small subunit ribosomal protein S20